MVTFEGGVSQALHFAYSTQGRGVKSQWEAIERNIKRKGDAERVEAMAEKAVSGLRINLQGLNANEISAQRMLIQVAVDNLPPIQSRTIKARYCRGWEQTGAIGHLLPSIPVACDSKEVDKWLVYAAFGLVTIRSIAEETKQTHYRITEGRKTMCEHIERLESIAHASLYSVLAHALKIPKVELIE